MTDTMERIVTNEVTGGKKGRKVARFSLIPVRALTAIATHFGKATVEFGGKYDDRNWEKGVDWSLNYDSLMRHITEWWAGNDLDEDGNSHLAAVGFHVSALIEYAHTHPELDDRPTSDVDGIAGPAYNDGFDEGWQARAYAEDQSLQEYIRSTEPVPPLTDDDAVEHLELPQWRDEIRTSPCPDIEGRDIK